MRRGLYIWKGRDEMRKETYEQWLKRLKKEFEGYDMLTVKERKAILNIIDNLYRRLKWRDYIHSIGEEGSHVHKLREGNDERN